MRQKTDKGITLIALVITIIVLLVLAGVIILTITGENGILGKNQTATEETNKQTATEMINLKITNAQIQSYAEEQQMPDLQYLADRLYEDNEIQYVYNESQKMAVKQPIKVSGEYIYTKLEEYPYEFKIGGDLRLAAVDGIEIADNKINIEDFVSKEEYNKLKEDYNSLNTELGRLAGEIETLKNRPTPIIPMIDTSKHIKSLTVGETYTATEDCIFTGTINVKPVGWWTLYVDGKAIAGIGENGAGNIGLAFPNVFLKKGSTITVGGSDSSYYYSAMLNIWGVK